MFQTKVIEKTKTHILCSITFLLLLFIILCRKILSAGQVTYDNMAHAYWMLDVYLSISVSITVHLFITGPGE